MSFLSRRTSRSDHRGGRAGAGRHNGSEDGYDYVPDDYQQDDDDWSPDEYFSPEGIKGRWAAGARPGERAEPPARDRGRPGAERGGYGEPAPGPRRGHRPAGGYGRDSRRPDPYPQDGRYGADEHPAGDYAPDGYGADGYGADDYPGDDYGTGDYGPAEYGTGGYELPDGSDDDRGERTGGRRRRDRGERGERGERKRRLGRRDRGDDIWPDDGVSDEDYWASVASDRPLTATGSPLDGDPMNVVNNRPLARPGRAGRPGVDSRLPADRPPAADPRVAGESRTGSGRLGPAPGQAGYPPGAVPGGSAGASRGSSHAPSHGSSHATGGRPVLGAPVGAGGARGANSGPMARPGTGPMPARPAPGSHASGSHVGGPNVGGPNVSGPHVSGPNAFGPGGTRSATGPQAARPGTGPAPARHATGPHATGPHATGPHAARPAAGLAQPGHTQSSLPQPTIAQPALAPSPAQLSASQLNGSQVNGSQVNGSQLSGAQLSGAQQGHAQPSFQPANGRGSSRQPEPDWAERTERIERIAAGYPDPRANGRGQAPAASIWGRDETAERHPQDREPGRGTRGRGADDDPLTSRAYSRETLASTDGRSYRVASRRAQVSPDRYTAALTEQTQTFTMNGQYGADPQAATARYPVQGGEQSSPEAGQQRRSRHSRQPSDPYDRGYPYPSQPYPSRPAASDAGDDRPGRSVRNGRPAGYGDNGRRGGGHGGNGDGGHGGHGGYDGYGNGGQGGYGNGRY